MKNVNNFNFFNKENLLNKEKSTSNLIDQKYSNVNKSNGDGFNNSDKNKNSNPNIVNKTKFKLFTNNIHLQ